MFCLYRISGQPSLCCGIQWWSTQARMTPHCAGKNCTELTIKIYVDARLVSLQLREERPDTVWSKRRWRWCSMFLDNNQLASWLVTMWSSESPIITTQPLSSGKNLRSWKAQGSFEKVYYAHLSPSSDLGSALVIQITNIYNKSELQLSQGSSHF